MRCSCRVCGTYMIQSEKGLMSGCKCPNCFNVCRDCMGSAQGPLDVEELKRLRFSADAPEEERQADAEDTSCDWRSRL